MYATASACSSRALSASCATSSGAFVAGVAAVAAMSLGTALATGALAGLIDGWKNKGLVPADIGAGEGYYTVRHFIEGGTMPGAGVLNIIEWRTGLLSRQKPGGVDGLRIA